MFGKLFKAYLLVLLVLAACCQTILFFPQPPIYHRVRRGGELAAGHSLLFFRFLRLAGAGLSVGFFVILGLMTTLVPFSANASPQAEELFVISIVASFVCITLGVPLMLIGNRISPPDPWLDTWLTPFKGLKPRKLSVRDELPENGAISAIVEAEKDSWGKWQLRNGEKCFVRFESGFMFLEPTGGDPLWIELKTALRTGEATLLLDTGRWNYGKVTLTFDSASDADEIEREIGRLARQSV
jgi:hypothetical protein